MRFPVAISREGWTGREERGARGTECPIQPTFSDTWGGAREGGARAHEGVDIFAGRGTTVFAPETGRIVRTEGDRQGHAVRITADAGRRVWLLAHLDDYLGPSSGRIEEGARVGRVGTTGDADGTCPHLHVELRVGGVVQNPYDTLRALLIQEQRRAREGDAPQVLALSRVLLEVADEWQRSEHEEARPNARALRELVATATATAAAGRADAALEGLRTASTIVARAPAEWTTPSLLRTVRDLGSAAVDAVPAAAAGLGVGLVAALAAVGAGIYLWSRR